MMKRFLNNDHLMTVLRTTGEFFAIWPLDESSSRGKIFIYNTLWCIYLINSVTVLPAIAFGIYCCSSGLVDLMKSLVELVYLWEAFFNIVYCRRRKEDLKCLLTEMELFEQFSTSEEKKIKHRYLNQTKSIYTILPTIFVVGALIFVFSPLVMNRAVPLNAVYFFLPITEYWGYCAVYALNILTILQASVAIVVDLVVVTILMHASYKFDVAGTKMQTIIYEDLRKYISLHQEALRYARKVDKTVTPIVVKSTAAVCLYMITCSLLLLNNVPFFELTQFFLITFLSCLRLFVCSLSAQSMTEMAMDVGRRVYAMPWCRSDTQVRKTVLIIIKQCQQPVVISASGAIPTLSLSFCGWVLYKTFSYFMTLRAILHV